MASPNSSSEGSSPFGRLHPEVQRWVWRQGWEGLRDVQEQAIPVLLDGANDAVIAAATSGGKTEAAFLPICSRLASRRAASGPPAGFEVLYVSPLRALINDQTARLESLCRDLEIPVHRWHGDVSAHLKTRARRTPSGVVLITPESIEALLVRRGREASRLFGALDCVVVDELHAFFGTERGKQLQSLLRRIERAAGRRVRRVGLSATLADLRAAAEFMRPGEGAAASLIESVGEEQAIRLQIRGYEIADAAGQPPRPAAVEDGMEDALDSPPAAAPIAELGGQAAGQVIEKTGAALELSSPASVVVELPAVVAAGSSLDARPSLPEDAAAVAEVEGDDAASSPAEAATRRVARHLFETLRARRNLVFASSRHQVELYASLLEDLSDAAGVPNEFFPHHGSLARELREAAEARMRDESRPATILCTTTLELGIDVGSVESVAQIGPAHAVSSMRQRLGRSGRRAGTTAALRGYVTEPAVTARTHLVDALRPSLVRATAMTLLLLKRWNEPARTSAPHLSTLLHQVLALVAQEGGAPPAFLWEELCKSAVFASVDASTFEALLRRMGAPETKLLEQAPDGTLMLGPAGEKIVESREFYAVFQSPEEWRVVAKGRLLGALPAIEPWRVGALIVFAGRRWRVRAIDDPTRTLFVERRRGGKPPSFGGEPGEIADGVLDAMRAVYESSEVPAFLDETARRFLYEGRQHYAVHGLSERPVVRWNGRTLLFPWVGTAKLRTLALALGQVGVEAVPTGLAIEARAEPDAVREALRAIAADPPDPVSLARAVEDKAREKYDRHLGEALLCLSYARSCLDVDGLGLLAGRLSKEDECPVDLPPDEASTSFTFDSGDEGSSPGNP